jgi:threonine dehydrogenase-like Zn-dependent dehydrogenase
MNGGQAQFMRVPNANANVLVVPPGDEHELDYLLLADIWPTAWFALDAAGKVLGDRVVVLVLVCISLRACLKINRN